MNPFAKFDEPVLVTVIDCQAGAITFNAPGADVTPPKVAVMEVAPCERALNRAVDDPMVATERFDDAQVTRDVRFCVDPSEYVPVAVKSSVRPSGRFKAVVVTPID